MMIQIALESADQPEIVTLIEELDAFHDDLYPAESNHLLDIGSLMQPNVIFCVARADGDPVGCGAAVVYDDYAEIKRMFVSPVCRGRGVGGQMLAYIEAKLMARNVAVARLETGIHSTAAIQLYQRSGYRTIPAFGDYWDDPFSLFYEKELVDHA